MNKRQLSSNSEQQSGAPDLEAVVSSKYFKTSNALRLDYYDKNCVELAKCLLGKVLCRKVKDQVIKGKIVETEGYLGIDDGASHSYKGKRTERNSAMFVGAGTAYVYKIYGMYHCFNISSKEEGSAVLIRALEPMAGMETMRGLRAAKRKDGGAKLREKDLCSGPSKLCQALAISKEEINLQKMFDSEHIWLEDSEEIVISGSIITSKRVGIEGAGKEWAQLPLRFYIHGNSHVSVKDKEEESKR